MTSATSNVLIKVFARGFYKEHSGFLIFLFVALLSYCFFINTAGDVTLLPKGKELYYHFIVIINFVSSPAITGAFFIAWLIYTIKCWSFVSGQLTIIHHQFLFYSITSSGLVKQFQSWFYTQFIIGLPFVCYAAIAVVTGLFIHQYLTVAIIVLFTLLLIAVSAVVYIQMIGKLIHEKSNSTLLNLIRRWQKPFFSLFIYQVFHQLKLTYIITKVLSYLIIISLMFSLADVRQDIRVAGIAVLGVVTAHAILVFQQHKFLLTYLGVSRNLPFSIANLYLYFMLTYILLLTPEFIWLILSFSLAKAIGLIFLMSGLVMLFHSILYVTSLAMDKYLLWITGLFFLVFLIILFGLIGVLIPGCLMVSFWIFSANYYNTEPII